MNTGASLHLLFKICLNRFCSFLRNRSTMSASVKKLRWGRNDQPSGTEVSGDNGDLATWFEKLRLPRNFTVAKHRHNPDRPPGLCSVGLCNRQPTYEDERGGWPICGHHYEMIKQREAAADQETGL